MDVDNGPSADGSNSGAMDVEQSLLQQFSCMGTTDKEELVRQLQKLLGSHLNDDTAVFFLDMNNWNLQAAVCSYFDIENSTKLPSMALVSDPVASESESIEPNTAFHKIWHVINNGMEQWPQGCYAQCSDGFGLKTGTRVVLPALKPLEDTRINVQMVSPADAGVHQSKWRLCTENGTYFGDPMWVIVTVVEEGPMVLTQQLSRLTDLGVAVPLRSHSAPQSDNDAAPPDGGDAMW